MSGGDGDGDCDSGAAEIRGGKGWMMMGGLVAGGLVVGGLL